jgi:3-phosphoshikimate 1-carboxyvinyltransferase
MPGDKSISHRAAMIAALANGTSRIENYSTAADCAATVSCLRQLGVRIEQVGRELIVQGVGPREMSAPGDPLDCGNSGTTMRLLAGILAGQDFSSVLIGDESLQSRPMQRIIEPLEIMGANISSDGGHAPLRIRGRKPLEPVEYKLLVASAQVKSSILLAGLTASGRTQVVEATPTRDHTERMLRWFGANIETGDGPMEGETFAAVSGPAILNAREVRVPGDISSAAYFIAAAALLKGSSLEITNVGSNPARTIFITALKKLGFAIDVVESHEINDERCGTIRVNKQRDSDRIESPLILDGDMATGAIDELPLLAVVGSQIEGGIEIRNAKELRVKESDRIAATVQNLRVMGAEVEEFDDGLRVAGPTKLRGAKINSCGDHRIAMAFTVAALVADGESEIEQSDCVAISFPEFFELLDSVVER